LAIIVDSLTEAAHLSNFVKPTHLQILVEENWELLEHLRQRGTILLGQSTPKLIGDYLGNIGVETFLQVSQVVEYSPLACQQMADCLETLAKAEEYAANLEALRFRNSSQI
jgi:histidinol dehydrogenase